MKVGFWNVSHRNNGGLTSPFSLVMESWLAHPSADVYESYEKLILGNIEPKNEKYGHCLKNNSFVIFFLIGMLGAPMIQESMLTNKKVKENIKHP